MKKVLSIVIVMSFLFQCFSFGISSAEDLTEYDERSFLLLRALDIIDFDYTNEDSLNTKVTRGEFAVAAAKTMGVTEKNQIPKTRYFKDVSPMERSAAYIHALFESGIVNGTGMGEFKPNENILPKDAVTIMLRIAGYHKIYQTEAELSKITARYNLMEGLSVDYLTNAQMAEVIYKVLLMPMPSFNGISVNPDADETTVSYEVNDENNTVLYEYFKCYEAEGILNATEGVSVNGQNMDHNQIVINDMIYSGTPDGAYDMLGYDVLAYIKEVPGDLHKVILIIDSGRNKVTEINLKDLSPVSENLYLDYYDESTGKTKQIQLPANTSVLVNGQAVKNNVCNAFNGKQGKAVIVNNGSEYIAKIFEYDSVLVSTVNKVDNMIYAKFGKAIETENTNNMRFVVIMPDGSKGSIDSIQSGMFLTVFRSEVCVEIYASSIVADGMVTAVSEEKITIDGKSYEIEPTYVDEAKNKISVGTTGTFWFNIYGELAYYDTTALTGNYGILVNAFTDELFDATLMMKIFTTEGKMLTVEAKDKPKVDGEKLDAKKAYDALVSAGGGVISQVITYKLNGDGKVSEIDTVAPNPDGKGLIIRKGISGEETAARVYDNGTNMMLPDIVMKQGAPVIQMPKFEDAASAEDKKFKIITNLQRETTYDCIAYASDTDGFYTDVVVMEREDSLESFSQLDQPFMVVSVNDVLDEDGLMRKQLVIAGAISQRGGSDMGIMNFMVTEDYALTETDVEKDDSVDPYNQDPGVPVMPEALGEGDMIRVIFDQDMEIIKIKRLFDYSDPNDTMLNINKKEPQQAGNGRFAAGYAVKKADNYVAMSTSAPNGNITEFAHFSGSNVVPIIVFDETRREDKIYLGSYEDVLTYEETGSDASIVIPVTFYGPARSIFIYRYGR